MMLDVKEVSRLLSVSEKTLYRWLLKGEIPAYKIGQSYRFNRVELLEWATAHKIKVSTEIIDDTLATGSETPALTEAINAGGIYYNVAGGDKESILKSIVATMKLPEDVDRNFLTDALLARENLGTTGIGDGIAIPHVRNPVVFHINTPVLSLCFLDHPVDFAAIDGKPVDTVFTLMTPTVRSHLHLLSRLGYALHLPSLRQILHAGSSREEIIAAFGEVEIELNRKAMG